MAHAADVVYKQPTSISRRFADQKRYAPPRLCTSPGLATPGHEVKEEQAIERSSPTAAPPSYLFQPPALGIVSLEHLISPAATPLHCTLSVTIA